MKLNQNSLHAKLYRYFYEKTELPDNLCPYFWSIIFALIGVIPYTIFMLPAIIIDSIRKKRNPKSNSIPIVKRGWSVIIIILFMVYSNYHLVRYWLNCYSYDWIWATAAGVMDSVTIILIGYVLWEENGSDSIIVEFAKAKFYKYCPQIKWK